MHVPHDGLWQSTWSAFLPMREALASFETLWVGHQSYITDRLQSDQLRTAPLAEWLPQFQHHIKNSLPCKSADMLYFCSCMTSYHCTRSSTSRKGLTCTILKQGMLQPQYLPSLVVLSVLSASFGFGITPWWDHCIHLSSAWWCTISRPPYFQVLLLPVMPTMRILWRELR